MNTDTVTQPDPPPGACPRCDAAIPPEAPGGLCPHCVLLGAATPSESGAHTRLGEPPPLEVVRAAFPQLEIAELFGRGGMGFVYRARQPHLDRTVALKLLPLPAGTDPSFAERFAREGRLLARLNHPNIVAVYEFGQAAGFAFLLLEFVDGVNLRQAMQAGRFSPHEALTIVPKICEALQFAHDHGVLHRDIKPENILLDAAGRVKIADFGIAKLVGDRSGEQSGEITLTASGARLGTPHYMAPEQVEKPSEVDHRADIYSLGVVFYELLTGELPLGRFAAPSTKADLDARVDAIVMRALAKERELRQQSAREVRTEVEGLGTPDAGSPPPNPPPTAGRWIPNRDFEYKSPRTLFGVPLVHVVSGWDPKTGRPREARGILAVGPRAIGGVAVGAQAFGILAFGGMAVGGFALGGLAIGGLAFGGLAAGLAAFGGLAFGLLLACGGIAIGLEAFGGIAVGKRALGGLTVSQYPASWFLAVTPWLWLLATIPALVPIVVSIWVRRVERRLTETDSQIMANPWPHRLFWLLMAGFALPLSAVVAASMAPMLSRASGDFGGITAGLVPMTVGALLVWMLVKTRPTTAQPTPRDRWNPWPKRVFVALIALVVLPLTLLIAGLVLPYLAMRRADPPIPPQAPSPATVAGPTLQFRPIERIVSDSQVRLRWELHSPQPASVRLSFGRQSTEFPLSQRGVEDFRETVTVQFEAQNDGGAAVQLTVMVGDTSQGHLFHATMGGVPRDLLAKANELVAGELALKFNTPVWIAFFGYNQVVLEALPEPHANSPTPPQ